MQETTPGAASCAQQISVFFQCAGIAMINFIPKKQFRELPSAQNLSLCPAAEFNSREGTRGHIINIAREYICVFNFEDEFSYGNDTALMIAAAASGCGISMPEGDEGYAAMRAAQDGVLRIDEERLRRIHEIESVRFTTLDNDKSVLKGQMVASVQVLSRTAGALQTIEKLCHECRPVIDVLPVNAPKPGA